MARQLSSIPDFESMNAENAMNLWELKGWR